jgi:KaiC/GvpD/RAD55 family RecA-like ATPase
MPGKSDVLQLKNKKEYIALVLVDAKSYQSKSINLIKQFTEKENVPGVYVTLNKPFDTMQRILEEDGIDTRKIIFIDGVTKIAGGRMGKTHNCLFIGSPEKLSDIGMALDQAVRSIPSNEKFVFFDSLSTLLLYNKSGTVGRFSHFLTGKMRVWKVKGILISLEKESDEILINELTQFCDTVIDFSKAGKKR